MNWVIKFGRIKRIMIGPLALLVILWLVDVMSHGKIQQHQQSADISALQNPKQVKRRGNNVLFAVYSANTPSGKSLRGYDYTFILPLTALAWERIGFRSVIIIIGSRCQWNNDPVLKLILSKLEERKAVVIFIEAHEDNRNMLSQTARIFTANMDDFPGELDDYIITSDSDLWPLHKEHFVPHPSKQLVLVHPDCCHVFEHKTEKYRMYAMSNIGATVSTWRQILNEGHTVAKDAETILDYFEKEYAPYVRNPVNFGSAEWYLDQQMVSIRLNQWIDRNGNDTVHRVSDEGYERLDRVAWNPQDLSQEEFEARFDAHLPTKIFLPDRWDSIRPLLRLMYGKKSWQFAWSENYYAQFYAKVKNYVSFTQLTLN